MFRDLAKRIGLETPKKNRMAFQEIKIEELRLGMFVKLECSWWRHPFATNKFKLVSKKDFQTIKKISKLTLYYDPDLSDPEALPGTEQEAKVSSETPQTQEATEEVVSGQVEEAGEKEGQEENPPLGGERGQRVDAFRNRRDVIKQTERVHQEALLQSKLALKKMAGGDEEGLKAADRVLSGVGQILRQDKLIMSLIEMMNSGDQEDPVIFHSLNVSIMSMMVGKKFNLSDDEIYHLGVGALSHDIGKVSLPQSLKLTSAGFAQNETNFDKHVEHGMQVLERLTDFPEESVKIVEQHHERLNGKGHPRGLKGDEISFLAQIVMVVDEYDEMCNNSERQKNLTPYETLSSLFQTLKVKRTGEFDENILLTLIRILGVYPPGTLVELNNGSVGSVININSANRTAPQVLLYTDDRHRDEAIIIDLADEEDLKIVKSLRPSKLPKDIRDYLSPQRMANFMPNSSEILAAR